MSVKSLEAELKTFDSKVEEERMALIQRIENEKAIEKMKELGICPPSEIFRVKVFKGVSIVRYAFFKATVLSNKYIEITYQAITPKVKGNIDNYKITASSKKEFIDHITCENNVFLYRKTIVSLLRKTIASQELWYEEANDRKDETF